MNNLIEIRWHGRGGQGAKTASLLLADAAFNTGKYIQGFPEYGPERMGAPITAYNRISNEPITVHSNIYYPDYVVVVDDTLIGSVDVTKGLKESGAILINTNKSIDEIKNYFKERKSDCNKGDFGKVGILGGSINYTGSIKLAYYGASAMRSGAGIVRLIIKKDIAKYVIPNILEETIFILENNLEESIKNLDALAIGMGWQQTKENEEILKFILKNYKGKLVIDADGLNILANNLNWLKDSKAKIVLTPHIKEFSRLIKIDIEEILKNKEFYVQKFTNEYNVILLLKGERTIIADKNNFYKVNKGCAGMATAGSGDVLSGILVGMLGYNNYNLLTVAAGAYINGLAGELAQSKNTDIAMIASDTIKFIPDAIKMIREELKMDVKDNI